MPSYDLAPALGSGTTRLLLENAGAAGDSVHLELVQEDTLRVADFSEHPLLDQELSLRERVVGSGRGVLGAQGAISLDLPYTPNPRAAFVKVMTWSRRGMRYGRFPISDLGPLSVRGTGPRPAAARAIRVELRGTQVRFLRGGRGHDADGSAR